MKSETEKAKITLDYKMLKDRYEKLKKEHQHLQRLLFIVVGVVVAVFVVTVVVAAAAHSINIQFALFPNFCR